MREVILGQVIVAEGGARRGRLAIVVTEQDGTRLGITSAIIFAGAGNVVQAVTEGHTPYRIGVLRRDRRNFPVHEGALEQRIAVFEIDADVKITEQHYASNGGLPIGFVPVEEALGLQVSLFGQPQSSAARVCATNRTLRLLVGAAQPRLFADAIEILFAQEYRPESRDIGSLVVTEDHRVVGVLVAQAEKRHFAASIGRFCKERGYSLYTPSLYLVASSRVDVIKQSNQQHREFLQHENQLVFAPPSDVESKIFGGTHE